MAVWMALMLVVLVGMGAFAVDVSYWHYSQTRLQRAADAAALAGAVSFPGDLTRANSAALGVAASNGYGAGTITPLGPGDSCPLGAASLAICAGAGDQPYQYRLKIVQHVTNTFGQILGMAATNIAATATAEYLKPLAMGSPSNQYGNDPDNTNWPINAANPPFTYPNFWGNIEGAGTAKQQGDAYAANWCDIPTDGCNGSGDGQNLDYTANGYYYTVDFTGTATTSLQVFDPAFVNVGSLCDASSSAQLGAASNLTNIPSYPQGPTNTADIHKRFQPVTNASAPTDAGYEYCTGDQTFPNSAGGSPVPNTTYRVLKASVPGDPSSAQQVCGPVTYPGYNGNVATPLQAGTTLPGAPAPFATYFRQWVNLCQVSGQPGDEYFIQVSTDNGSGSNHFSLRGTTSSGGAAPVTIAGNTYMGIFTNVGSNQLTKFSLVRVPGAAAGHTLVLNFYDIGDSNQGTVGQLQVMPPPDSNIGSSFSNCTWSGSNGSAVGFAPNTPRAPWGPANSISSCLITGVNSTPSNWNAQWSTVTVPIPSGYTCADSDPSGCWITINEKFTGAVHDVTSWNAFLLGDPVRLVK